MTGGHVAVIDVGKTNAKLALVDHADLSEIAVITRPNKVLPGPPWPHFDTEGHWEFLLKGLERFQAEHGIDAIVTTTHGACAALLSEYGTLAAPILDYEHPGPDDLATGYDAIRPPFDETGSPRLGMGLNLGSQLFWQFATDPDLKARTNAIVTYPQYWGFRLSGMVATDVTSLGCHTDLWNPYERRFSSLVDRLGIAAKIAPAHQPSDVLGSLLPEIAERTGLSPDTPVLCGIHDSNASLLPHIVANEPPFSVVSTGTWVIAMAIGSKAVTLDPARDTLINVNAFGDMVPSARFMGGREHDLAMGGSYPEPTDSELEAILRDKIMLLPALVTDSGPFRGHRAHWLGQEPEPGTALRGAAVALYLGLVTGRCLKSIGHDGTIIVEGPFAGNKIYLRMLAAVSNSKVIASKGTTGTSQGAALLVRNAFSNSATGTAVAPSDELVFECMRIYAQFWSDQIEKDPISTVSHSS